MMYRTLGKTGLRVSEIGFGAWGIGGDSYGLTRDETSSLAISAALDLGCNFFDTADVYGNGHSEYVLGHSLRAAGRLDNVIVATKGGGQGDFSFEGIVRSAESSLRRLQRSYIDVYMLHDPSLAVLRSQEAFDALAALIERGLVRHAGASLQTAAQARTAVERLVISVVQLPFNMLQLAGDETSVERAFEIAARHDVGIVGREALAAGLLSGRHDAATIYDIKDRRGAWPTRLRHERLLLVDALRPLLRPEVPMAQVALRYALDQPFLSNVLVGMKTPEQVRQNFAACSLPAFSDLIA